MYYLIELHAWGCLARAIVFAPDTQPTAIPSGPDLSEHFPFQNTRLHIIGNCISLCKRQVAVMRGYS
ncbi:hypothetical protein HZ326_22253 [Fusarium oxysporum f. sp. albedinis]|nr:hypothetical protein HZ326_22253 [Fusarium oxysporum f. sp. albedinis]